VVGKRDTESNRIVLLKLTKDETFNHKP